MPVPQPCIHWIQETQLPLKNQYITIKNQDHLLRKAAKPPWKKTHTPYQSVLVGNDKRTEEKRHYLEAQTSHEESERTSLRVQETAMDDSEREATTQNLESNDEFRRENWKRERENRIQRTRTRSTFHGTLISLFPADWERNQKLTATRREKKISRPIPGKRNK